jgi:nitroreductase
MEALEAIRRRHSVREFADRHVPADVIEKLVDCGRLAPTARKEEPWEFVAVTKRESLVKLAEMTDHGRFIAGAACAIVVTCRDTKYYLEDGCAATENILVAAEALGLGACWVAGDKKPYCAQVLKFISAPEGARLISILAIGYPKSPSKPLTKRPLKDVMHWESF